MNESDPNAGLIDLLLRIGDKEELAFRLLYERTSSKLFALAMRVVRQRESAEDALQECFITIWKTAESYQSCRSPPSAWLAMIVKSRALDAMRKHTSRRGPLTDEFDELTPSEECQTNSTDPMDAAEIREKVLALHESLTRLPQRQRSLIFLAFLQGLTHAEISRMHELPVGTVKSSIRHGLAKLRLDMNEGGGSPAVVGDADAHGLARRHGR